MGVWLRRSVVELLHVNPDCRGNDRYPFRDMAALQRKCATRPVVQESRGVNPPLVVRCGLLHPQWEKASAWDAVQVANRPRPTSADVAPGWWVACGGEGMGTKETMAW